MNYNEFKMYATSAKAARYIENKIIEDMIKNAWTYISDIWGEPEEAYDEYFDDDEITKEEFLAMSYEEQREIMYEHYLDWLIDEKDFIVCRAWKWISSELECLENEYEIDEFLNGYGIDEDKIISLWKSDMLHKKIKEKEWIEECTD